MGTLYKNGVKFWLDREDENDKIILNELESLHSQHTKSTLVDDIIREILLKIQEAKSLSSTFNTPQQVTASPSKILQSFGIQKPNRNEISEFKSKMLQNGFEFNRAGTVRIPNTLLITR